MDSESLLYSVMIGSEPSFESTVPMEKRDSGKGMGEGGEKKKDKTNGLSVRVVMGKVEESGGDCFCQQWSGLAIN